MNKLTLKDIAQALNISITTVSKALKDYPDVSWSTKKRVIEYSKKMNFKPNVQASYLRTRETKILGVVVPTLIHYFFSNVVEGIVEKAEEAGYMVLVLCTDESEEREKKLVKQLLQQNVDGIFISISHKTRDISHLKEVLENQTVMIVFDRISKFLKCSNVVINDREAGYIATKHLIEQGCQRIAHFRGGLLPQIAIDRYLGYRKALEDHGLEYDKLLVDICENGSEKDGYQSAQKFYRAGLSYDGLFTISDPTAAGAIRFLHKKNIRVPEDIAVVGFSNWQLAALTTPAISTIDQSGFLIGVEAMRLFMVEMEQRRKKEEVTFNTSIIPSKLIVRESSLKKNKLLKLR